MKTTTTPQWSARTLNSVQNGINILETAIKHKTSLSEASRDHGFGRNYLSDVKSRIKENRANKNIDRNTYSEFMNLYKAYKAEMKAYNKN